VSRAAILTALSRPDVSAALGRGGSISGRSVPQSWACAAPAMSRSATALPQSLLVGLPEAELDGLGPGYGGTLPGSLTAAAAGGGGAAGGGWAATRGSGATQRRASPAQPGDATRIRTAPHPRLYRR